LMTAMVMTWFFMKLMGDPVGAKHLGITMLFSFVGLVAANVLTSRNRRSTVHSAEGKVET